MALQCSTDPAECMAVNFSASECGNTAGQSAFCGTQNGCIDVQSCTGLRGDCNGDGQVTSADVTCQILRIFDEKSQVSACEDCNGDGVLTSADVTCIILHIFGEL